MGLYHTKLDLLGDLSEGAFKSAKKLDNNTWEYTNDAGNRTIRLHHTDIIEFLPRNKVRLNSGGWLTVTTKARFNNFLPLPIRVYTKKRQWYVFGESDSELLFFDGITVPLDGRFAPSKKMLAKINSENRRIKRLEKLIDNYCKKLRTQLKNDGLPMPNGGDCWYCSMYEVNTKKPLGDLIKDNDHLTMHLKQKYIMGSLIYNAMVYRGYKADFWFGMDQGKQLDDYHINTYIRAVRNYFRSNLGLVK